MKKNLIPMLCISLFFLVGCGQKQNDNDSLNTIKTPSSVRNEENKSGFNDSLKSPKQENINTEEILDEQTANASTEIEEQKNGGEIFEIREKMFITQCNDIYLNPEDYKEKTIKLSGVYDEYIDDESGQVYHYVIRYGPGCCGNDGVAGFEFFYDGDMPEPDDWIEAVGTIEIIDNSVGYQDIIMHLSKITILEERGAEYVVN